MSCLLVRLLPVLTLCQGNPRSSALKAIAKANKLELEIVDTVPEKGVSADYLLLNKLGKVPTFQGADGYVLSECIAIAIYRTCPTCQRSPLQAPPVAIARCHTFYDENQNTVIPV
jgi:hypothetical protein